MAQIVEIESVQSGKSVVETHVPTAGVCCPAHFGSNSVRLLFKQPQGSARRCRLARWRRGDRLRRVTRLSEPAHVIVASEKQRAAIRALTPQQRLEQALRMNRSMRELMAAGIRQRQPEWSEAQIARAVAARILHARTG